jgi:hypothetical protein
MESKGCPPFLSDRSMAIGWRGWRSPQSVVQINRSVSGTGDDVRVDIANTTSPDSGTLTVDWDTSSS